MELLQTTTFKSQYKKLHSNIRSIVNTNIKLICENPCIGQEKKQDLKGVYVHKFKFNTIQYLLAYRFTDATLTLLALGTHENFYRDLKKRPQIPI